MYTSPTLQSGCAVFVNRKGLPAAVRRVTDTTTAAAAAAAAAAAVETAAVTSITGSVGLATGSIVDSILGIPIRATSNQEATEDMHKTVTAYTTLPPHPALVVPPTNRKQYPPPPLPQDGTAWQDYRPTQDATTQGRPQGHVPLPNQSATSLDTALAGGLKMVPESPCAPQAVPVSLPGAVLSCVPDGAAVPAPDALDLSVKLGEKRKIDQDSPLDLSAKKAKLQGYHGAVGMGQYSPGISPRSFTSMDRSRPSTPAGYNSAYPTASPRSPRGIASSPTAWNTMYRHPPGSPATSSHGSRSPATPGYSARSREDSPAAVPSPGGFLRQQTGVNQAATKDVSPQHLPKSGYSAMLREALTASNTPSSSTQANHYSPHQLVTSQSSHQSRTTAYPQRWYPPASGTHPASSRRTPSDMAAQQSAPNPAGPVPRTAYSSHIPSQDKSKAASRQFTSYPQQMTSQPTQYHNKQDSRPYYPKSNNSAAQQHRQPQQLQSQQQSHQQQQQSYQHQPQQQQQHQQQQKQQQYHQNHPQQFQQHPQQQSTQNRTQLPPKQIQQHQLQMQQPRQPLQQSLQNQSSSFAGSSSRYNQHASQVQQQQPRHNTQPQNMSHHTKPRVPYQHQVPRQQHPSQQQQVPPQNMPQQQVPQQGLQQQAITQQPLPPQVRQQVPQQVAANPPSISYCDLTNTPSPVACDTPSRPGSPKRLTLLTNVTRHESVESILQSRNQTDSAPYNTHPQQQQSQQQPQQQAQMPPQQQAQMPPQQQAQMPPQQQAQMPPQQQAQMPPQQQAQMQPQQQAQMQPQQQAQMQPQQQAQMQPQQQAQMHPPTQLAQLQPQKQRSQLPPQQQSQLQPHQQAQMQPQKQQLSQHQPTDQKQQSYQQSLQTQQSYPNSQQHIQSSYHQQPYHQSVHQQPQQSYPHQSQQQCKQSYQQSKQSYQEQRLLQNQPQQSETYPQQLDQLSQGAGPSLLKAHLTQSASQTENQAFSTAGYNRPPEQECRRDLPLQSHHGDSAAGDAMAIRTTTDTHSHVPPSSTWSNPHSRKAEMASKSGSMFVGGLRGGSGTGGGGGMSDTSYRTFHTPPHPSRGNFPPRGYEDVHAASDPPPLLMPQPASITTGSLGSQLHPLQVEDDLDENGASRPGSRAVLDQVRQQVLKTRPDLRTDIRTDGMVSLDDRTYSNTSTDAESWNLPRISSDVQVPLQQNIQSGIPIQGNKFGVDAFRSAGVRPGPQRPIANVTPIMKLDIDQSAQRHFGRLTPISSFKSDDGVSCSQVKESKSSETITQPPTVQTQCGQNPLSSPCVPPGKDTIPTVMTPKERYKLNRQLMVAAAVSPNHHKPAQSTQQQSTNEPFTKTCMAGVLDSDTVPPQELSSDTTLTHTFKSSQVESGSRNMYLTTGESDVPTMAGAPVPLADQILMDCRTITREEQSVTPSKSSEDSRTPNKFFTKKSRILTGSSKKKEAKVRATHSDNPTEQEGKSGKCQMRGGKSSESKSGKSSLDPKTKQKLKGSNKTSIKDSSKSSTKDPTSDSPTKNTSLKSTTKNSSLKSSNKDSSLKSTTKDSPKSSTKDASSTTKTKKEKTEVVKKKASTVRVAKPKKIKTLKRSTKAEDVDAQLKQEGGREHAQTPTKTPEAKKARSRKVEERLLAKKAAARGGKKSPKKGSVFPAKPIHTRQRRTLRTTRSVLTYNKNAAYEEELRKEEERRMYMRAQRSARKDDDLSPLDLEDDPSVAPFKRLRQLVKDSHVVKGRLRRVKVAKKSKKLDDLTDEEDSARTMMVPQDEATGGEEGSDVMVDEAVPEGVSENVLPIIEDGEEIDVEKVDEMLEQPLTETKAEEVLNRLPVKRPKIMRRRKICGSKGKRFIKMFAKRKRQNAKLRLLSAEGKDAADPALADDAAMATTSSSFKSLDPALLEPATSGGDFEAEAPESAKRLVVCKETGETLLHKAARQGHLDVARHCVEVKGMSANSRDNAGYTPLHECSVSGSVDVGAFLIARGADVNASALADGIRPLHDCVDYDSIGMAWLLLSCGADPRLSTYSGRTPAKIARTPRMKTFIHGHLADLRDDSEASPWEFDFYNEADGDTKKSVGNSVLNQLPPADENEADDLLFDFCEEPPLPVYHVTTDNTKGPSNYHLVDDVINKLGISQEDFLLKNSDLCVVTITRCELHSQLSEIGKSQVKAQATREDSGNVDLVELSATLKGMLGIHSESLTGKVEPLPILGKDGVRDISKMKSNKPRVRRKLLGNKKESYSGVLGSCRESKPGCDAVQDSSRELWLLLAALRTLSLSLGEDRAQSPVSSDIFAADSPVPSVGVPVSLLAPASPIVKPSPKSSPDILDILKVPSVSPLLPACKQEYKMTYISENNNPFLMDCKTPVQSNQIVLCNMKKEVKLSQQMSSGHEEQPRIKTESGTCSPIRLPLGKWPPLRDVILPEIKVAQPARPAKSVDSSAATGSQPLNMPNQTPPLQATGKIVQDITQLQDGRNSVQACPQVPLTQVPSSQVPLPQVPPPHAPLRQVPTPHIPLPRVPPQHEAAKVPLPQVPSSQVPPHQHVMPQVTPQQPCVPYQQKGKKSQISFCQRYQSKQQSRGRGSYHPRPGLQRPTLDNPAPMPNWRLESPSAVPNKCSNRGCGGPSKGRTRGGAAMNTGGRNVTSGKQQISNDACRTNIKTKKGSSGGTNKMCTSCTSKMMVPPATTAKPPTPVPCNRTPANCSVSPNMNSYNRRSPYMPPIPQNMPSKDQSLARVSAAMSVPPHASCQIVPPATRVDWDGTDQPLRIQRVENKDYRPAYGITNHINDQTQPPSIQVAGMPIPYNQVTNDDRDCSLVVCTREAHTGHQAPIMTSLLPSRIVSEGMCTKESPIMTAFLPSREATQVVCTRESPIMTSLLPPRETTRESPTTTSLLPSREATQVVCTRESPIMTSLLPSREATRESPIMTSLLPSGEATQMMSTRELPIMTSLLPSREASQAVYTRESPIMTSLLPSKEVASNRQSPGGHQSPILSSLLPPRDCMPYNKQSDSMMTNIRVTVSGVSSPAAVSCTGIIKNTMPTTTITSPSSMTSISSIMPQSNMTPSSTVVSSSIVNSSYSVIPLVTPPPTVMSSIESHSVNSISPRMTPILMEASSGRSITSPFPEVVPSSLTSSVTSGNFEQSGQLSGDRHVDTMTPLSGCVPDTVPGAVPQAQNPSFNCKQIMTAPPCQPVLSNVDSQQMVMTLNESSNSIVDEVLAEIQARDAMEKEKNTASIPINAPNKPLPNNVNNAKDVSPMQPPKSIRSPRASMDGGRGPMALRKSPNACRIGPRSGDDLLRSPVRGEEMKRPGGRSLLSGRRLSGLSVDPCVSRSDNVEESGASSEEGFLPVLERHESEEQTPPTCGTMSDDMEMPQLTPCVTDAVDVW